MWCKELWVDQSVTKVISHTKMVRIDKTFKYLNWTVAKICSEQSNFNLKRNPTRFSSYIQLQNMFFVIIWWVFFTNFQSKY